MLPTPHGDKLRALLENHKLPDEDRRRVELASQRYRALLAALDDISIHERHGLRRLVEELTEYRRFLDLETIFDSPVDFLYRLWVPRSAASFRRRVGGRLGVENLPNISSIIPSRSTCSSVF